MVSAAHGRSRLPLPPEPGPEPAEPGPEQSGPEPSPEPEQRAGWSRPEPCRLAAARERRSRPSETRLVIGGAAGVMHSSGDGSDSGPTPAQLTPDT